MLVNVGHDNSVNRNKVIAVARPGSAPVKRLISAARDSGLLIDLCNGKACRSVIFTEPGQVLLCSVRPRLLRERLNGTATHPGNAHTGAHVGDRQEDDTMS